MIEVTVLTTVYDGMPYLRDSVRSIIDQSLSDWRFVIVDDGSTDGTAEFLEAIDDSRFTILRQPNGGTAAAANHGLKLCDTEFVARMDADDVSLSTRLEEQLTFLKAHPEVGLVGAQMAPLGERGIGRSLDLPVTHDAIMESLLAGRHGMAHSCILMRTALLKQVGGYWPYRLNDAWDMMLRMGEVSRLANIDHVLHHYRVHEGSQNGYAMRCMRFSVAFACELARRRRSGLPALMPDEFTQLRNQQPWWRRAAAVIDIHARCQYRLALAERHGNNRVRGAMRMSWAALCAPELTVRRMARGLRRNRTKAGAV